MTCPPHHWRLDSPNGSPTVDGRCLRCGEVRSFTAGAVDTMTRKEWNEVQNELAQLRKAKR